LLEDGVDSAYVAMDCAKLACESIKGRYDVSYRLFGDELKEQLFARRYVARHAEQAVTERWIHAYAQPVVDTKTGRECGFEALARWKDPTRGILSPAVFIPTLEDAHLIHKLDGCIVDEVCWYLSDCLSRGLPVVPASVNLSRLDFQLCDIFEVVRDACERWNIPHELLAVEITESALDGSSNLRCEMDRFRAAGFEVWMDDFGCGYSSLNLLKDYEFDVLKVDMEFLRDMEGNDRSKTIVTSVIEMARSLGIRTLVEGVETPAQRDFLREAGCDMMQGYLFGRPMPLSLNLL
jgi:EAL domain-containing protein (putative c-di-GMP-specific phosphodiesterase class I)